MLFKNRYSLKTIKIMIIALFLSLYTIIYLITTTYKNDYIQNTYSQQIKYLDNNYKVTTNHFKNISQNFVRVVLNQPKFLELFSRAKHAKNETELSLIRNEIYVWMRPHFDRMMKYGVNIMLFSFKDNKTFLRVHKPNKFNDDLSAVRYSFTYVNSNQKEVSGFEQGKISHAFRNIYPLHYKNEFLGSVDISFASDFLQENMTALHGIDTHFILNKNVFKTNIWKAQKKVKYVQSIEHKDFLYAVTPSQKECQFSPEEISTNNALKEKIDKNIKHNSSFALHAALSDGIYTVAFLPIKNIKDKKTIAYLVSYSDNLNIGSIITNYILINIGSIVVLLLLAITIYNNIKQRCLLEIKVKEEVEKNRVQQQHMFNQSRLAQMGEMISMIAHQWRQPLSSISVTASNMQMILYLDKYNLSIKEEAAECKEQFNSSIKRIGSYVANLTSTIDDFRNFYKPNKKPTNQVITIPITKALDIIKSSLEADKVDIIKEYNSKHKINMHENEMMQVILNILKNAQDHFKNNKIENPKITIRTKNTINSEIIEIIDNAGGVPESIISHIFDPYFSTKNEKQGTGLGLHMSRIIIEEHHNGTLKAKNVGDGACFIITLENKISSIV